MRVVVTGSSGFLGGRLVRRLDATGASALGIDRRAPGAGVATPGLGLLLGDLTDPRLAGALADRLAEADAVVHLAALPGVRAGAPGTPGALPPGALRAARRRDVVRSAERVLALTPAATPVVVASSSAVYGGCRDPLDGRPRPSRESDPLRPVGGYARGKARVEAACAARARWGVVSVVRPFTVAGEGQRPDMAVALWLADALAGRPLRVLGAPERTRDVTDVEAVVDGLVAAVARALDGAATPAAAAGAAGVEVVNLGSGTPRTLAEIAGAVTRAVTHRTGRPVAAELTVEPAGRDEAPDTWACTRRCRELLGVDPATDLDAVVARQLDHALRHGLLAPAPDATRTETSPWPAPAPAPAGIAVPPARPSARRRSSPPPRSPAAVTAARP